MHMDCMYIHVVDKYTLAVSVMCMFAVFIYMYIVWVSHSFIIFYNHKEPVSLLIVYVLLL